MDSDSNELWLAPTQSDQVQLSDISAIEMESIQPQMRKRYKILTASERLEMADLFRNFTKGRILQDAKNVAKKIGVSSSSVEKKYSAYKRSVEQKQYPAVCQGAGRPSVPHGQLPYFANASQLSCSGSLLAYVRGGRNHHVLEVRGKSRHRLPDNRVHIPLDSLQCISRLQKPPFLF